MLPRTYSPTGSALDYSSLRRNSRVFRDGYLRRTEEVVSLIVEIGRRRFRLLDIGSADGRMLEELAARFPEAEMTGLEMRIPLVRVAGGLGLSVIDGRAEAQPFGPGAFDVVTVVSTLKHIPDFDTVLDECHRVLVGGGHLIVSDPTPFGLRLGLLAGHFDPTTLPNRWSLQMTSRVVEAHGFRVVRSSRYMPAPVTFGGSNLVERIARSVGLSGLFMQQIVMALREA